jgi:hypothetical protein
MPGETPAALSLQEVAARLGVPVNRVDQYLRDGQLLAFRDENGVRRVPASLLSGGSIVKGLPGVITLLRDARFADEEILDWLQRPDESLPGTPLEALHENRGTEVKRRAQVAGY